MPNGLRITTLLFLVFAAAQQQQPHNGYRSSPQENAALRPNTVKQDGDIPLRVETSTYKRGKYTSSISNDKRAVATLAPADFKSAVLVPSARSAAGPSGALTTPPRARSLQDWEVENFVLLATVDGSIYARDRDSGRELWKFHSERPMVETTYHRQNNSQNKGKRRQDDYMWIVEPNEDGSLYVLIPGPDAAIQKLGMTVKELAEVLSPHADENSPFVFTAEKRNTLFTLNATNGTPLKYFSASGSGVMDQKSCRRINSLEMEDEEDECEPTPTLHLGRTEYTIGIQDANTMEDLCTIRYFEWTPNTRDRDLAAKYLTTMDNKYIYSRFDGSIIALEHLDGIKEPQALFQKKATSPVVRVFDVVRPQGADARDAPLVILPQPISPLAKDNRAENVFVNRTESGSWYAMSEMSYPSVTDGAASAQCCQSRRGGLIDDVPFWNDETQLFQPAALIGVHRLPSEWRDQQPPDIPTISPPQEPEPIMGDDRQHIDSGNITIQETLDLPASSAFAWLKTKFREQTYALYVTLIFIGIFAYQHRAQMSSLQPVRLEHAERKQLTAPMEAAHTLQRDQEPIPIPEQGAVQEQQIISVDETTPPERRVHFAPSETEEGPMNGEIVQNAEIVEPQPAETAPVKAKKHKRGIRGGRKNKKAKSEKNEEEVDNDVSRIMDDVMRPQQPMQPDRQTFIEGSIEDVTEITQINEQLKHSDQILGNGSGGTTVYEGTFEVQLASRNLLVLRGWDLGLEL
jgi:serine/threonine-protein kinase/endoribonuclease IRE1